MVRVLILSMVVVFVTTITLFSQHVNTWTKGNLTFVTKNKIEEYKTDDENVYDADNEYVGINMEVVDFSGESKEFLSDIQYGCKEICKHMELTFREEGRKFLDTFESYYVVCFGEEPVITAVVLRPDSQKAYEISIYCYEMEISAGVDILKSIKFKDR